MENLDVSSNPGLAKGKDLFAKVEIWKLLSPVPGVSFTPGGLFFIVPSVLTKGLLLKQI